MSKKNIHIKKYLKGNLPEPGVRVDDAWADMNDMLGGNPVPKTQFSPVNKLKFLLKGGLAGIAAIGIATSIWLLVPEEKARNTEKQTDQSSTGSPDAVQSLSDHTQKELGSATKEQKTDSQRHSRILKEQQQRKSDPENPEKWTETNHVTGILQESSGSETESHDHKPSQKRNESRINLSKTSSSARIEAHSEVSHGHSKKSGDHPGIARKVKNERSGRPQNRQAFSNFPNDLTRYQPSKPRNDIDINSGKINAVPENRLLFSAKKLVAKSVRFDHSAIKQTRSVSYNQPASIQNQKIKKNQKSLFETWHVGLEWNAASAFNSAKYVLKGTDSTSKPYLLLIPGIWISKDITENQLLRLSFYANQPFYGGLKRVQRIGADSSFFHDNISLIKATGINLALEYEYRLFQKTMASAGFSYSPLRKALAQDDYENYQGIVIPGPKLVLNKQNINQYMKTNLFMFKTGLTFSPGRYQFGVNMLIPLSNLSLTTTSSLKTLNGQFFFRLTVK